MKSARSKGLHCKRECIQRRASDSTSASKLLACCLVITLVPGCASMLPETTPFGAVKGIDSKRSLNGLGVHKKMWELAGAKCITPQKLSTRLQENLDVIVLVGQAYGPPGVVARNWLENWLAEQDGRTVIYFGRDFDADVYYRERTLDRLPTELRDQGAWELGKARVEEMNLRIRQLPESTFCRWFYLDTSQPRRDYRQFTGPWAADLKDLQGSWPVGVTLQTPSRKWRRQKPSWLARPAATSNLAPANQAEPDQAPAVQRSRWEIDELSTDEAWYAEFRETAETTELLAAEDGTPLVFRLSRGKLGQGKILVVANGAPFLNGSLVDPLHRAIGEKILAECLPAQRVALLAYDENGILIANVSDADSRAAGFEVLVVWPLSAITMPAALLGILICIVLFPILGRPQSEPARSISDFGLHVSALGRMLFESRDQEYAKGVIAEYFRTVRDEPPPYWLAALEDGHNPPAVVPPGGTTTADPSGGARFRDHPQTEVPSEAESPAATATASGGEPSTRTAAQPTQAQLQDSPPLPPASEDTNQGSSGDKP